MRLENSRPSTGPEVIRAGLGKRQYALRLAWFERLILVPIILIFVVIFLLPDLSRWPLILVLLGGFAALSEWVVWPRANYLIIHPQHVDTSQLSWGSKMRKRRRHRIRYEDVISVSGDDETGKLHISFNPSGGIGRRNGIKGIWADMVLRNAAKVTEVKEAIALGRRRARDDAVSKSEQPPHQAAIQLP